VPQHQHKKAVEVRESKYLVTRGLNAPRCGPMGRFQANLHRICYCGTILTLLAEYS